MQSTIKYLRRHVNIEILTTAGLAVNLDKSITSPFNKIVCLGGLRDLVNKTLLSSEERSILVLLNHVTLLREESPSFSFSVIGWVP